MIVSDLMRLRSRALGGAVLLIGGGLLAAPCYAGAQSRAVVRAEENFRRDPNGVVLARLDPGTSLRVLAEEGNWTQIELEGWVWLRSLQVSADSQAGAQTRIHLLNRPEVSAP